VSRGENGYRYTGLSPSNLTLCDWVLFRFGFEDFHLYFRGFNVTYHVNVTISIVFFKEDSYSWRPEVFFNITGLEENVKAEAGKDALVLSIKPDWAEAHKSLRHALLEI